MFPFIKTMIYQAISFGRNFRNKQTSKRIYLLLAIRLIWWQQYTIHLKIRMLLCQTKLIDEWYDFDINHFTGSHNSLLNPLLRFYSIIDVKLTSMIFVKCAHFSKSRFLLAYKSMMNLISFKNFRLTV